tara:strand:- start:1 stop:111 length:111 start_codon:yes stop_codon:yes gene_type:complete
MCDYRRSRGFGGVNLLEALDVDKTAWDAVPAAEIGV